MKFSSTLVFVTMTLAAPTQVNVETAALVARVAARGPAPLVTTTKGDEIVARDFGLQLYGRNPEPSSIGDFFKSALKKLGGFAWNAIKNKLGLGGSAAAAASGGAAAAASASHSKSGAGGSAGGSAGEESGEESGGDAGGDADESSD